MNGPLAKKKSRNRHSSGNNSFQSTSVRFQPETDRSDNLRMAL